MCARGPDIHVAVARKGKLRTVGTMRSQTGDPRVSTVLKEWVRTLEILTIVIGSHELDINHIFVLAPSSLSLAMLVVHGWVGGAGAVNL